MAIGAEAAEVARIVSKTSGLENAVYMTETNTERLLAPYAQAYSNGYKEIFVAKPPIILAADISKITKNYESYSQGVGIVLSKLVAINDWLFSHVMTGHEYNYALADLASSVIDMFLDGAEGLVRRENSAAILLTETLLKLSAIIKLSATPFLIEGGEGQIAAALEMLLSKEGRPLMPRGHNLAICSKLAFTAYMAVFKSQPRKDMKVADNAMRLDYLTEFFGVEEITALKKISILESGDELNMMLYKWNECREDFSKLFYNSQQKFERGMKIYKRLQTDLGYWMTRYLTQQDIKLIIALSPDVINRFGVLSLYKQTGLLDEYLSEV